MAKAGKPQPGPADNPPPAPSLRGLAKAFPELGTQALRYTPFYLPQYFLSPRDKLSVLQDLWPLLYASGCPSESDSGSPYIPAGSIRNLNCICSIYADTLPLGSPYKSGSLMSGQLSSYLCRDHGDVVISASPQPLKETLPSP